MDVIVDWYWDQLAIAALVFTRLAFLMIAIPSFSVNIPKRIKLSLAIALTLIVLPLFTGSQSEVVDLTKINAAGFFVFLVREAFVGVLLGSMVHLLIVGMQVAGEVISTTSGLQLGGTATTGESEQPPLLSVFVGILVTMLIFAFGAHRMMVSILLDSYRELPIGEMFLDEMSLDLMVEQLSVGVIAGVRLAVPIVVLILLCNLITGLISRTIPQVNLLAIGLSMNAIALFAGLALTIGSAGWLLQTELLQIAQRISAIW